MTDERRAPVQGDQAPRSRRGFLHVVHRPGTIAWSEHLEAWEAYAKRFGHEQSAERIAERHGFGYSELTALLGHEPTTWRPR